MGSMPVPLQGRTPRAEDIVGPFVDVLREPAYAQPNWWRHQQYSGHEGRLGQSIGLVNDLFRGIAEGRQRAAEQRANSYALKRQDLENYYRSMLGRLTPEAQQELEQDYLKLVSGHIGSAVRESGVAKDKGPMGKIAKAGMAIIEGMTGGKMPQRSLDDSELQKFRDKWGNADPSKLQDTYFNQFSQAYAQRLPRLVDRLGRNPDMNELMADPEINKAWGTMVRSAPGRLQQAQTLFAYAPKSVDPGSPQDWARQGNTLVRDWRGQVAAAYSVGQPPPAFPAEQYVAMQIQSKSATPTTYTTYDPKTGATTTYQGWAIPPRPGVPPEVAGIYSADMKRIDDAVKAIKPGSDFRNMRLVQDAAGRFLSTVLNPRTGAVEMTRTEVQGPPLRTGGSGRSAGGPTFAQQRQLRLDNAKAALWNEAVRDSWASQADPIAQANWMRKQLRERTAAGDLRYAEFGPQIDKHLATVLETAMKLKEKGIAVNLLDLYDKQGSLAGPPPGAAPAAQAPAAQPAPQYAPKAPATSGKKALEDFLKD